MVMCFAAVLQSQVTSNCFDPRLTRGHASADPVEFDVSGTKPSRSPFCCWSGSQAEVLSFKLNTIVEYFENTNSMIPQWRLKTTISKQIVKTLYVQYYFPPSLQLEFTSVP